VIVDLFIALLLWATALGLTLVFELSVAWWFGVGRRGLQAVALANVATNGPFTLAVVTLYAYGIGYGPGPHAFILQPTWVFAAIVLALEVVIVFVEWGLLFWALGRTVAKPSRLLVMCAAMNLASALASGLLTGFGR
jgi:hypothetical protein